MGGRDLDRADLAEFAEQIDCERRIGSVERFPGEAGVATAPAGTTRQARARLRAWALLEFEIERDPDRPNGEIASAVGSSVPAVIKARRRFASGRSRVGGYGGADGGCGGPRRSGVLPRPPPLTAPSSAAPRRS
jgi:hypothetical protein